MGFENKTWSDVESLISLNSQAEIGISALIYCFKVYPNLEDEYKKYYINKLIDIVYSPTPSPKRFSIDEIKNIISYFDLDAVNAEINNSDNKVSSRVVNYNYYDSLPLFANLNSDLRLKQLMKDSENQYYYLSGELVYPIDINFSECQNYTLTIKSEKEGVEDKQITVYSNFPCFEKESFVGPVTGVKFFRIFNDGPPSSGYFDSDTLNSYIKFDENINNSEDYLSNNNYLFSFSRDESGNYIFLKSGIQTDTQGAFCSAAEYIEKIQVSDKIFNLEMEIELGKSIRQRW